MHRTTLPKFSLPKKIFVYRMEWLKQHGIAVYLKINLIVAINKIKDMNAIRTQTTPE